MEGGTAHLPLVDDAMRAHPLTPSEWRERLQATDDFGISTSKADSQGSVRKCLLLDVRNGNSYSLLCTLETFQLHNLCLRLCRMPSMHKTEL